MEALQWPLTVLLSFKAIFVMGRGSPLLLASVHLDSTAVGELFLRGPWR